MSSIADAIKLTRQDIITFQEDLIKLLLQMQKDGWRGIRNKNGHVTMYSPDGKSHIMATSNKNAYIYVKQRLDRYNAGQPIEEEAPVTTEKKRQDWPCPMQNCQKIFINEEKLGFHIAVDHQKKLMCPEPGCTALFDRPNLVGLHRRHKHGYVSPNYKPKAKKTPKPTVTDVAIEMVEKQILGPAKTRANGDVETEVVVETPDGDYGYTETTRPLTPAGARSVELTEDILNMDVRTLIAVFKAAGMEVAINVADRP